MNILVIGNGFDIAHGLRTSYKDFLWFVKNYAEWGGKIRHNIDLGWNDGEDTYNVDYIINLFNKYGTDNLKNRLVKELDECIKDNKWINHFESVQIGEGWVDFEREISKVIRTLDDARKDIEDSIKESGNPNGNLKQYQMNALSKFLSDPDHSIVSLKDIELVKIRLLEDLNKLIRSLEIYLGDEIDNIPIERMLPQIEGLNIRPCLKNKSCTKNGCMVS